jgi:hypothetical protein
LIRGRIAVGGSTWSGGLVGARIGLASLVHEEMTERRETFIRQFGLVRSQAGKDFTTPARNAGANRVDLARAPEDLGKRWTGN